MFAPGSTITLRRAEKLFVLLFAASSILVGGCRRKETSSPSAAGRSFSDGVAERLQQELETAQKADPREADRVKAVRPLLHCVEPITRTEWRARFGYASSASGDLPISVSAFNRFWPAPEGREQPKTFEPGAHKDVVQVSFSAVASTAWCLGSACVVVNARSTPCRPKDRTALK